MPAFEDAKLLTQECKQILPEINNLYAESVQSNELKANVCIKVKTFLEHLRAALDYCATAIYKKYGTGKPSHKPYFPYATSKDSKADFVSKVLERALPGLSSSRPDICEIIEQYQYFGNTGNWMPTFMELANENKHREFTPHAQRTYRIVEITGKIPPKTTVELDLKNLKLGDNPDNWYRAQAIEVTTYEFVTTGTMASMFLATALCNVQRIVEELVAIF